MFSFEVDGSRLVFSKFFSVDHKDYVLRELEGQRKVLFIDTPPYRNLVSAVADLLEMDVVVDIRDHHAKGSKDPRWKEWHEGLNMIRYLLPSATIVSKHKAPACCLLIETGEFRNEWAIVADPDPDGLFGAMKALGLDYPGMEEDAVVLDNYRLQQEGAFISETGRLLVAGMKVSSTFGGGYHDSIGHLFHSFIRATQGDTEARDRILFHADKYSEVVNRAKTIANTASPLSPSVAILDVTGYLPFHLETVIQYAGQGRDVIVIRNRKDCLFYSVSNCEQLTQEAAKNYKSLLP